MITITNIFNKVMLVLGAFLIILGIIAMAGSANDCGGACMENANTIPEMLMAAFIGLCMFVTGVIIMIKGDK